NHAGEPPASKHGVANARVEGVMTSAEWQFIREALLEVPGTIEVRRSIVFPEVDEEDHPAVVISPRGVCKRFTPCKRGREREAGRVALCKLDLQGVVVRGGSKEILVSGCSSACGATGECRGVFRQ